MRRSFVLAVSAAVAVGAASLAVSARGAEAVTMVEAGGATFPERAFVVTLPADARLRARDIAVRENGERVADVRVTSVSAASKKDFAIVLAIDTSNSMKGKPIDDAMLAARAFVARRTPDQMIGIVTFDSRVRLTLPLTNDAAAIDDALARRPELAQGTRIFDGVSEAVRVLADAKIGSGAVVVLSDGTDYGSTTQPWQAVASANRAHVRVFAVGLRSRQFDRASLQSLAANANGTYTEADTSRELLAIYEELGARLSNQYIVRYRSLAGPNRRVKVGLAVRGTGTATTGYTTPGLELEAAPPYHRSLSQRFWGSTVSMLVAVVATMFFVVASLVLLLRPRSATLRRRMSNFVTLAASADPRAAGRSITGQVFDGAEQSLARMSWWPRFKEELEVARIRIPGVQIVVGTLVATILVMWLLSAFTGSALFAVLGLGVPLAVRTAIKAKLNRARNAFAEQLADNLQVCASALRAGHSFIGALSVVVEDSAEPSRTEFRRVVADEQLGVPLEDALEVVVRRMANRELEQVALVASLQRDTGGNSAEVLDQVTETIRDRAELKRLVRSLTAQGRMSRWVLTLLPVGLMLAIAVLNPEYIAPLFDETLGRVMLVGAAIMITAGSLIIKRIVDIKV